MFEGRLLAAALFPAFVAFAALADTDTTVTFQGQLQHGTELHDGTADMAFRLFDSPTEGDQVGATIFRPEVPVKDGLFQLELDFGATFGASPVFLEVSVAGQPLSPRQRVTAAPLAVHALSASAVSMALDDLDDVDVSGAGNGEYLHFDGSGWISAPDSGGSNWSESADDLYYDSGNVSIGTSGSPDSRLLVVGDGSQGLVSAESPAGDTKLHLGSNGGLSIGSGLDEAPENGLLVGGDAVFDAGNVGIGIGSASGIQKNLHLIHNQYTGLSGGGLAIENEYNNAQWLLYSSQSTSNLSLYFNNALRGTFDSASGNYTATSDDRLKTNVAAMGRSLGKLMLLKPKRYEVKNHAGEFHYGFIAQDLMQVLPEVVSINPDDGSGQGTVYTVAYTEIIPVLVSGIQEQQAIIESLRDELDALKLEVENLKD